MPSFTYTTNIPASTDVISQSQPTLQTNCNSVNSILNVDHYTFQSSGSRDGYHKQITFPANNVPSTPSSLASVLYTNAGTADSSSSQLFYVNSVGTFCVSLIKAFATISGTSINNGMNVTSVTNGTTGIYKVTLSYSLPSVNYMVIATPSTPSAGGYPNITCSYVIKTVSTFWIYTQDTKNSVGLNVPSLSFIVLQV